MGYSGCARGRKEQMPSLSQGNVLIIEDALEIAELYAVFLQRAAIDSHIVSSVEEGLTYMRHARVDVVVLDVNLRGINGYDVIKNLHAEFPAISILAVASNGSVRAATDAIQIGACDFLVKPVSADRLSRTVRHALENAGFKEPSVRQRFCGFIGASPPMQNVYRVIEAAANSNVTVFITGESGTGKEVAAEAIHQLSPRKGKPFVALNCGAISKDLAESELFGHCRGSFTGAIANRLGAVQQANGGTLFLDELCEMPLDLQIKLLRFLQSGTFRPVGATRTEDVNARIICATNRDPLEEVRLGRLREDLYYRLHVIPISLPPLREREDDALLIAKELLARFAKEDGRPVKTLSDEARATIRDYSWPGNIRQLQNILRHAVVLHEDEILTAEKLNLPEAARSQDEARDKVQDVIANLLDSAGNEAAASLIPFVGKMNNQEPGSVAGPEQWNKLSDIVGLASLERVAISRAIELCDGNVPKAAALLGVNPSTLYRRRQSWDAA